jgi:hypothetical protein
VVVSYQLFFYCVRCIAQAEALSLLVHLAEWLEGWAASLAGAGLNPDQLGAFITAKSEFWLFLVEVLTKLAENPDMEVRCG